MKKQYFKETGKTTWSMESWFEKMMYIIGWISSIYLALCFFVGFMIGFMGAL